MSPNWRIDNGRHKLKCGVVEGIVSTKPIGIFDFNWRVEISNNFAMPTPCDTVTEGMLACEKRIREIMDDIRKGLGELIVKGGGG